MQVGRGEEKSEAIAGEMELAGSAMMGGTERKNEQKQGLSRCDRINKGGDVDFCIFVKVKLPFMLTDSASPLILQVSVLGLSKLTYYSTGLFSYFCSDLIPQHKNILHVSMEHLKSHTFDCV